MRPSYCDALDATLYLQPVLIGMDTFIMSYTKQASLNKKVWEAGKKGRCICVTYKMHIHIYLCMLPCVCVCVYFSLEFYSIRQKETEQSHMPLCS